MPKAKVQKPRNEDELSKWPQNRGKTIPCWKGGWITGTNRGKQLRVPASCKRWDCFHCGRAKKKQLWWRFTEGVRKHWPKERFALLTLTYRWKRTTESVEQAIARAGVDSPLGVRLQRSPMEWRKALTRDFRVLYRRYERDFGEKLSFFRVIEITKGGAPHHHAIIRITKDTDEEWFRSNWADITRDGHPVHCADLYSKGRRSRLGFDISTNRLAFNYVFKYIGKSFERSVLAGTGIHKYAKSRDWRFATIIDFGQLVCWNENRGYYQYDIVDYQRNYGKRYYYNQVLTKQDLTPRQQDKMNEIAVKYDMYDKIRSEKLLQVSFDGNVKNLAWHEPEYVWDSIGFSQEHGAWRF